MKRSPRVLLLVAIVLAVTTGVARAGVPVFFFGADIVRLTTRIDDQTGGATSFSGTANAVTLRLKAARISCPFSTRKRTSSPPRRGCWKAESSSGFSRTTIHRIESSRNNRDAGQ
jgi:hypothetical protein